MKTLGTGSTSPFANIKQLFDKNKFFARKIAKRFVFHQFAAAAVISNTIKHSGSGARQGADSPDERGRVGSELLRAGLMRKKTNK